MCMFRRMVDTDSDAWWTVIPAHAGHRFRSKVDTHSILGMLA